MNNTNRPLILLIVNRLCGSTTKPAKNTGHKGPECIEGVMEKVAVAKDEFAFDSVEAFEDKDEWKDAIAVKDIVPLFDAYVVTNANTEATNYSTGKFTYETAPAVKIRTFEAYLGFCSHAALKSYANSVYTRIFEFNNDGSIVGVNTDNGGVKGQLLSKLGVGIRQASVADKPATTVVTLTYADYNELEDNACVIKPGWTHTDIPGIFDVELELISATATSIKFKAYSDCGSDLVTNLVAANVVVKNAAGVTQTTTFVAADANGVYTINGTAFATGYTVSINGVVIQAEIMYEGVEPLVVTIT